MNQELKKCLLKEKSGILWYFYISEENRLMYSIKSSGGWSKPAAIDRNLIKYFSAAIDINGRIYVIAYTHTKILIYYEWDGYQWLHKLIHRTQSRFESIPFLSLLSAGQSSHIFYYVENALSKSRETLVHFYLSRYDWDKGPALHFSSDDRVLPLRITSDPNGNIYFIYCQNNSDKYDWHLYFGSK